MATRTLFCLLLSPLLGVIAGAQSAPAGKTAILQVQTAVLNTREGHQAFSSLNNRMAAKKVEFDKRQTEIAAMQDQLQKGSATMSDEAQRKLAREIDRKTKALNYEADAAQADYEQEQTDVSQALLKKFRAVVDKYARDNGFGLVIDVSNPQTPAFWWANAMDITNEVVRTYDAAYPVAAGK
ncbi:MAG TPA: OmpH family outer membrane protein [Bryobacteraceae bacterium]|nr:OmpH family outer membrane protein [Bryobacteraceae bacterium]